MIFSGKKKKRQKKQKKKTEKFVCNKNV